MITEYWIRIMRHMLQSTAATVMSNFQARTQSELDSPASASYFIASQSPVKVPPAELTPAPNLP